MSSPISAPGSSVSRETRATSRFFAVKDYDLAATLECGQAFRWHRRGEGWEGVIGDKWVHLRGEESGIWIEAGQPQRDWRWAADYLQLELDWAAVARTFPDDPPMRAAVAACRGLRLLQQDPWECLASFILSSTKQIVQIRQMISLLTTRYGEPVAAGEGAAVSHAFPTPERLAAVTEAELRECKLGFRAPYLRETARSIADGEVSLADIRALPLESARERLTELPGVGRKIADCVLLFAYGRQDAFPMDVWVARALRELYFPRRRVSLKRLHEFAATHFGPNAGYAQQYLFHHARTKKTA